VAEGARSGRLSCDRIRSALARHSAVVLASACGADDDGDPCTLDDEVIRLAEIALGRALGARDTEDDFEPSARNQLLASTA
jgi:hypothetical protein